MSYTFPISGETVSEPISQYNSLPFSHVFDIFGHNYTGIPYFLAQFYFLDHFRVFKNAKMARGDYNLNLTKYTVGTGISWNIITFLYDNVFARKVRKPQFFKLSISLDNFQFERKHRFCRENPGFLQMQRKSVYSPFLQLGLFTLHFINVIVSILQNCAFAQTLRTERNPKLSTHVERKPVFSLHVQKIWVLDAKTKISGKTQVLYAQSWVSQKAQLLEPKPRMLNYTIHSFVFNNGRIQIIDT